MFASKHNSPVRAFSYETDVLVVNKDRYMIEEGRELKLLVMKMLLASCDHTYLRWLIN